jgi:hypothetical protein
MNEEPAWAKDVLRVGDKLYARCDDCGSLVRLNKRFFNGLHFCSVPGRRGDA